jgi:heme/copper-type cytochrome/quinol oxidase subunit 4
VKNRLENGRTDASTVYYSPGSSGSHFTHDGGGVVATPEQEARAEAEKSLKRVQEFNASDLIREEDLGRTMNFAEAVEPAQRLIDLYNRLAVAALEDFPADKLNQVRNVANQDYNLLSQILEFSVDQANPQQVRQSHIQQISNSYPATFNTLHPLIAYSLHRSADFQRLDREARATVQGVQDRADDLTGELEQKLNDATRIVDEVRKVAAETGVSQQAIYFRDESTTHSEEAEKWRGRTVSLAWALGIYAVLSILFTEIPFLVPETPYESIQLGISKVLIFAVISYMLYLSAKNFLSLNTMQLLTSIVRTPFSRIQHLLTLQQMPRTEK